MTGGTAIATATSSVATDNVDKVIENSTKEVRMIGEYKEEELLRRAKDVVNERTADWTIVKDGSEERLPKLSHDEITIGKFFGHGGFFTVSEIKAITLRDDNDDDENDDSTQPEDDCNQQLLELCNIGLEAENNNSYKRNSKRKDKNKSLIDDEDYFHSVVQNRKFMAKHCIRKGKDCRYAIKSMRIESREDPDRFVDTVVDLALEAKFLSVVRHPNIIKIRAMSAGPDLFQPDSFIILDRLYGTLTQRLEEWEKQNNNGFAKLFDFQKKKEKAFFAERLTVAYDVASALSYLHDLNIIYRDLKPDNIGFDVRGDVKIFDFGLATEFDSDKIRNGTFKLTGDTGTIRYMAPEVAEGRPYNETADVYSFGILLWQIMSLKKPYGDAPGAVVERKVVYCGTRPPIDQTWPGPLCRLLKDMFASNPRRPQMEVVCDVLRQEINKLSDKKLMDGEVLDSARSAMSARTTTTFHPLLLLAGVVGVPFIIFALPVLVVISIRLLLGVIDTGGFGEDL